MKKFRAFTALFLLLIMLVGCGKNYEPIVDTEFDYADRCIYAKVHDKDGNTAWVSNKYNNSALELYNLLVTDSLTKNVEAVDADAKWINIEFFDDFCFESNISTTAFRIYKNGVLSVSEADGEIRYKVGRRIYSKVKKFLSDCIAEDNSVCSIKLDANDMYDCALKDGNGKVRKDKLFKTKPRIMRVGDTAYEIRTGEDYKTYTYTYYDAKTTAISDEITGPSDYFDGYYCYYFEDNIIVKNLFDRQFTGLFNSFEKALAQKGMPILKLRFHSADTLYVKYLYGSSGSINDQYFNIKTALNGYGNTVEHDDTVSSSAEKPSDSLDPIGDAKELNDIDGISQNSN